jgi:hypothetical protein
MTMTRTAGKTTKTAAAKAAAAEKGRRMSLGTAWATTNEDFYAGTLNEATPQYQNQQQLLDLLGAPAEGYQWRIKLFVREVETKKGTATVVDAVIEEEPIYQR